MANGVAAEAAAPLPATRRRSTRRRFVRRKSWIAFLMALPLIALIGALVVYPAFYSLYLAMLNKGMEHFVGLRNFSFLFRRDLFWLVVMQSVIFDVSAFIFKSLIGFVYSYFVHKFAA